MLLPTRCCACRCAGYFREQLVGLRGLVLMSIDEVATPLSGTAVRGRFFRALFVKVYLDRR